MTSILCKRAVAFRIRRADADTAGTALSETDWRYFSNEDDAWKASDALGTEYQALYTRDGTAIVAEWELIGSAPTDGCFLVCDINDDRGPFLPLIVSAKIFWMARKEDTPSHLRLAHMTHWMPLPAPPSPVSRPLRGGDQ
jgi:hypothetical protein